MTNSPTQAQLALYLGETYAEVEIRTLSESFNLDPTPSNLTAAKIPPKTSLKKTLKSVPDSKFKVLFKKNYFLPQTSLKSLMAQVQKNLQELQTKDQTQSQIQVTDTYVVCRYFDRLKTFRLGGSVVQIVHQGFENSYAVENTSRVSLAASSLVISIGNDFSLETSSDVLNSHLQRIKKINPEANKVAIELDASLINPVLIEKIKDFFTENGFKIFNCDHPQNLMHIRKTLLNAGSEGTKEEIVTELKDNLKFNDQDTRVHFWIKDQFHLTDSKSFENFELYFSSQDFLSFILNQSGKKNLVHFDLENWMILSSEQKKIWDSPWGLIDRTYHSTTQLAVQPFTEILIDETARLQFSKNNEISEPGPMIAGRGVKSLLIDLFWDHIYQDPQFKTLFLHLENPVLQNKIESQFKVLEKGQNSESKALNKNDMIQFIKELIDFELELNLGHSPSNTTEIIWCGHLANLIRTPTAQKSLFSWTEHIFNYLQKT